MRNLQHQLDSDMYRNIEKRHRDKLIDLKVRSGPGYVLGVVERTFLHQLCLALILCVERNQLHNQTPTTSTTTHLPTHPPTHTHTTSTTPHTHRPLKQPTLTRRSTTRHWTVPS